MAAPRRVQLITFSNEATLPPVSNSYVAEDPPSKLGLCPVEPGTAVSARIELVLFEPDDRRCPEFYYPELIKAPEERHDEALDEMIDDKERNELEALARKFEEKYGGAPKRRTDRLQDLVDIGYGYDENDSFIDNSEAYDELVPAALTTKHGGFYINSGTLQFRQVSDESEDHDDFEENLQPKKRKLKAEGENKKKKRKDYMQPEKENKNGTLPGMPPEKKKKKKTNKPLSIDVMLKKFHKEKLQQLQMLNVKGADCGLTVQSEVPEESTSADPLLSLIGSTSADDLLQAVKAVDQDFDLDKLLTEDQDSASSVLVENEKAPSDCQPVKPPASLPDGLSPVLELRIKELIQTIDEMEEVNKTEVLAPQINEVLLQVAINSKELPHKVFSRVISYLASQLSCKKGTLLKRTKNLQFLYLDGQLQDSLERLEDAVTRTMPEQIDRFNDSCQAHSEARAAKMEAEKEQRTIDGSDDEDDDKIGKRIFGPRKRFKWTEELRELLFEVVKLKMSCFELETHGTPSLEEYLKAFLEDNVKPLWPKGWMQSRILLIESRKVHGHITGVVARKKSMTIPKPKKADSQSEDAGEVQAVRKVKKTSGVTPAQRKLPGLPLSTKNSTPNDSDTLTSQLLDVQTSAYFSPSQANLRLLRGETGNVPVGSPPFAARPFTSHQRDHEEGPATSLNELPATDSRGTSSPRAMSTSGVASTLKQPLAEGEKTQMLTLMAPPAAAEKDSAMVQGVARLLTTTSFCKAPVSEAVAAVEGSCGDPALPTPSLSHKAASYSNLLQTVGLTNFIPLHALPFPGLALASKPSGHAQTCNDSIRSKPTSGSFEYSLTHDGSQLHPDGPSALRRGMAMTSKTALTFHKVNKN